MHARMSLAASETLLPERVCLPAVTRMLRKLPSHSAETKSCYCLELAEVLTVQALLPDCAPNRAAKPHCPGLLPLPRQSCFKPCF